MVGVSCRKDKEITTQTIVFSTDPVVYVHCSITGVVTDQNGEPLRNVSVALDAFEVNSDDNGFFYLKDIQANQNGASIRFEKAGYYTTSKLIYPRTNRVEFIEVSLLKSDESGIVRSSDGGRVRQDSVNVFFPANSLQYSSQNIFEDISVHFTYIHPTDDLLSRRIPGSLIGINQDRRVLGMETFGVVGVQLFDEGGNNAGIDPELKATFTMSVPPEILGVAPMTASLWRFDVKSSYWIEEGTADLVNNQYVGQISQPGFWCVAQAIEVVNLKAKLTNTEGVGLIQLPYVIRTEAPTRQTGYGITNDQGILQGKVPSNKALILDVFNPCGELIFTENMGPLTSDEEDEFSIDLNQQMIVRGTLYNCFGEPINKGYVKMTNQDGDYYVTPGKFGTFESQIALCNSRELKLQAYNMSSGEKSRDLSVVVEPEVDLGIIEVCSQVTYQFELFFPQGSYTLTNCTARAIPDSSGNMEPNILVTAEDGQGELSMEINANDEGNYPIKFLQFTLEANPDVIYNNYEMNCTVEQWEAAPSIARGSIEGRVFNTEGDTLQINGRYTAIRN